MSQCNESDIFILIHKIVVWMYVQVGWSEYCHQRPRRVGRFPPHFGHPVRRYYWEPTPHWVGTRDSKAVGYYRRRCVAFAGHLRASTECNQVSLSVEFRRNIAVLVLISKCSWKICSFYGKEIKSWEYSEKFSEFSSRWFWYFSFLPEENYRLCKDSI